MKQININNYLFAQNSKKLYCLHCIDILNASAAGGPATFGLGQKYFSSFKETVAGPPRPSP
jgi:hypothetical protein